MGGGGSKCPECNCDDAVKTVTTRLNSAKDVVSNMAQGNVFDKLFDKETQNNINRAARPHRPLSQEILDAQNQWKKIQPTTIETFENDKTKVMKYIRDAIDVRHRAFKHTEEFQKDCENNSYATIDGILAQEKQDLDTLLNFYKTYVDNYKSLYTYKMSMNSIVNSKRNELNKINDKIDGYKKNLFVDNRQDTYQRKNYDFYKTLHFYILILYYSLFVLYLIFSKFISDKMYTNKKLLLFISLYLLLPILLKYILALITDSYIYILEHNNIREDTKSYEDLIKVE